VGVRFVCVGFRFVYVGLSVYVGFRVRVCMSMCGV